MQKVILLVSFLLAFMFISAEPGIPVIKATSPRVDIRVGNDYFLKGGWHLEPGKNPDVFSIGSKWIYDTKRVSFITDIDSVSFDVMAGQKYDFIILLNGTTPCHIEIETRADPVFMNIQAIAAILFMVVAVFCVCYFFRKKISSRSLIRFGYVAPALFWLMTIISGAIHGNYDHFKNVISELGAIGTRSELFTSSALLIISVACILFSIGFYRSLKEKRLYTLPAILSFAMPITTIWAAIFTLGNEFHAATGPLPFLIMLTALCSFFLWRKNKTLFSAAGFSLLSFSIMLLILLRFIKPFGITYEGLTQRFFYLGWSTWTITVAYYFSKDVER